MTQENEINITEDDICLHPLTERARIVEKHYVAEQCLKCKNIIFEIDLKEMGADEDEHGA